MNLLSGKEEETAKSYIEEAAKEAAKSTCLRSRFGSVIVKDKTIIGRGFNSPPKNLESQRRCLDDKSKYHKKVKDTTCCIHAEQRAIINALKTNPDKIQGSTIYIALLNEKNEKTFTGKPYCTICSKMVLETGIKNFVLPHEDGIFSYDTEEYNDLSFNYKE